jgi:multidrug efflux pump subunit AcrA (membrane-fusion protein)
MRPRFLPAFALLALAGCATKEEAPPKPVVEVKVARAEQADVHLSVQAPAYIFGRQQANLNSRVTAPIRRLLVRKGDNVAAGQLLAELDNRDLVALRDQAAAAVTDAEASLQRTTSATLPTDIERARGQAAGAAAAFNQAKKLYQRRKQLFEQGAIPQRDLLSAETDLAQARANDEVARKTYDLMLNQSRDRDIVMAKSRLDQARAQLSLNQAQLDYAAIRSPFAGTVTEQFQFPGDMAKPDAPIFTVMDVDVVEARAQVSETDAAAVHVGAACTFTQSDDAEHAVTGRISIVNQAVDPARRTVEVWCEMANPKRALRAGAFGKVAVVTGVETGGVVVPVSAVQFAEGTGKGVVMVAGDKNLALKREVETGVTFDGKVHIKSGLKAGETIIVQGAYGLVEGTQIKVAGEKQP